jgi:hypothetical protein
MDVGVGRGLRNFGDLRMLGQQINRRLLEAERLAHDCGLAAAQLAGLVLPSRAADGQPTPALKFGQPRVTALLGALCLFTGAPPLHPRALVVEDIGALRDVASESR